MNLFSSKRVRRRTFLLLASAVLVVVAIVCVVKPRKSPLVLTIRMYVGWDTGYGFGPRVGSEYWAVSIDASNSTSQPLLIEYCVQRSTFAGMPTKLYSFSAGRWVEQPWRGAPVEFRQMPNSEPEMLCAVIDSDAPCKVGVQYVVPPSRLWQRLPTWFTRIFSWGRTNIVYTEIIDWPKIRGTNSSAIIVPGVGSQ